MGIFNVQKLIDKLSDYIENKITIAKLEVKKEIAQVIAKLALVLVLLYFGTFLLAFFFSSIAWAINDATDTFYLGFIVNFVLVGIVVLFTILAFKKQSVKDWVMFQAEKLVGLHPELEVEKTKAEAKLHQVEKTIKDENEFEWTESQN